MSASVLPVRWLRSEPSGSPSPLPTESRRVALYVRVSTDDQKHEQQVSALTDRARSRGDLVVRIYADKASAWGDGEREQYRKLLDDVADASRGWTHLMFWRLDRFSRRGIAETFGDLERIEKAGVTWESITEPELNSETPLVRDLMRSLRVIIARMESETRSERMTLARGAIRRGERDGKLGGRPRRLTPEKVAEIVRLKRDEPTLLWREIAMRVGLPSGTCKRGYWEATRETPLPDSPASPAS